MERGLKSRRRAALRAAESMTVLEISLDPRGMKVGKEATGPKRVGGNKKSLWRMTRFYRARTHISKLRFTATFQNSILDSTTNFPDFPQVKKCKLARYNSSVISSAIVSRGITDGEISPVNSPHTYVYKTAHNSWLRMKSILYVE